MPHCSRNSRNVLQIRLDRPRPAVTESSNSCTGRQPGAATPSSNQPAKPREDIGPNGLPIVRVTAAERAEKTRKGLCWYCDDKWSRAHVCSKKFYALMGADEDDEAPDNEEEANSEDGGENMVITGDVSSIHVISPKIHPRAIRLKGTINDSMATALIDGGSTHNFIKPAIAEQLSIPVHSVTPFRVFVGNGESLRCSYACLGTPLTVQGHSFDIDLFILQVEGPDVILGVQWLQELEDVTKNYCNLTMKFDWNNKPVFFRAKESNHGKYPTTSCSPLLARNLNVICSRWSLSTQMPRQRQHRRASRTRS